MGKTANPWRPKDLLSFFRHRSRCSPWTGCGGGIAAWGRIKYFLVAAAMWELFHLFRVRGGLHTSHTSRPLFESELIFFTADLLFAYLCEKKQTGWHIQRPPEASKKLHSKQIHYAVYLFLVPYNCSKITSFLNAVFVLPRIAAKCICA